MSVNGDSQNSMPTNHVELYIRAGKDGECLGACLNCQRFYMILDRKGKAGELTFDVITINMARPPAEFKKFANRLPVLKHGDEILSDNDEIVQYLDENFPYPSLRYDNMLAHSVCLDIFSKFSFYIKQVSHGPENLLKELQAINDYLEGVDCLYLCGDELKHLDCIMLPKLQHIRVAAKAFKDFDIPADMVGLWKYLKNAYANDTFRKSCPSNQEIVHFWESKPETPKLSEEKKREYGTDGYAEPKFSFDVPL
ncbi:chloride intracellular channel protein 2-like isoform X1 [Ylistrum balloti]|uniref:chloride intracellular channel protein 2-like isoform X1 n=1 Tax=Ylistrum balloti TaxID=509963 RepID=UPI002905B131|nr:chloride intracellular channel protein 2-like isoform X1 [Ylistrum balloti]XP_060073781.1 chloride intracellular channel protein 2-like isoform X1 [Ylistrum balloti]